MWEVEGSPSVTRADGVFEGGLGRAAKVLGLMQYSLPSIRRTFLVMAIALKKKKETD